MKKRSDSELLKKNGGTIRPGWIFLKHFGLIDLADFGVLKHFFKKKKKTSFISISLHFLFHFLCHLLSSSSSCLFFSSPSSLSSSPSLFSSLVLSSTLFSSLVFHFLSSLFSLFCLVLSLLFHLLLPSCLVSLSLSLSLFFLSVSVSLCLCLRVVLSVVLCGRGVVGGRGVCLVCAVCVCCGTLKKREKNLCGFENASVCTFKTSPCMRAPLSHVFQHVRVVPVHTGTY